MINFLIKEILKKNNKIIAKYKDQECYILGNGASIKNYNCSICNANYKSKEYLGSEPKCFKCRNIH